MALLSNASLAYVLKVQEVHKLHDLFLSAHGADSVPKPKPFGDGILHVLKELEVDHETEPQVEATEESQNETTKQNISKKIVYIGDSPSDGKAAKAANVLSIGVSWGSHPLENILGYFDHIVNTPLELLSLLEDLNGGKVKEEN